MASSGFADFFAFVDESKEITQLPLQRTGTSLESGQKLS